MKKNYFLKTVFTLLVCGLFSQTYAADWYISTSGNDATGDGLTAGTAWASFSKAQTAAAATGDVIHVSGMIDFTVDPANTTYIAITTGLSTTNKTGIVLAKSLTIQGGSSANDGFNGTNGINSTRFFQLGAFTLTLKNLKLANGAVTSNSVTTGGGAITMSNGNIIADNVIFDGNTATGNVNLTGAAIYIGGTNATGTSFTNCTFSNNAADKSGAIYINNWAAGTVSVASVIKFEACSFIGNESKLTNGGSALFLRSASNYTTCNIINCTFAKNKVSNAGNGGTIYLGAKAMASTNVNIINCTITENTTAGAVANCAGVYTLNTTANSIGNLYIYNSIIENNTTTGGAFSDIGANAISPTTAGGGSASVPGFIKIQNSIVGTICSTAGNIPAANYADPNQVNYLSATSTTNAFKAGLAPFNASTNSYALYTGSAAIGYGNSSFLSALSTTDQLGNVRTVGATNTAGAVESTPLATTTPSAPTALVATAGDGQLSLAFKSASTGGSAVTNYKYSIDGGANYVACSPAVTAGPIVITGLTNDVAYSVKLKAVNANGDSGESIVSNSVTPTVATDLENTLSKSISVYKNANNQLVVNNSTLKTGTITICNAVGQRIISTTFNSAVTTINKILPSGVYMILVHSDGKSVSTKIVL